MYRLNLGLDTPPRRHAEEGKVIFHVFLIPALTGSELQSVAA
jgi:hypothetical protein